MAPFPFSGGENSGDDRARCRVANGFILLVLGLLGTAIVTGMEEWPITSYPMFDGLNPRVDTRVREIFVVEGDRERSLRFDGKGMLDFTHAIPNMMAKEGVDSDKSKLFLSLILRELDRRWKAGGSYGEKPMALRAYEVLYHYPAGGDMRAQVVSKTLRVEVGAASP